MFKRTFWLVVPAVLLSSAALALPVSLRVNALTSPIGIDAANPVFSWRSDAVTPNWTQSAYEVTVGKDEKSLREGAAWDSGKVNEAESVGVVYKGKPLEPQQRYAWRVVTWDAKGKKEESAVNWFETGLLTDADWKAQWIRRTDPESEKELRDIRWLWLPKADAMHVKSATVAHFRYELNLTDAPAAASLHVLARGKYVSYVNGKEAGHHDEWGAFDREEIAPLLHKGTNEITVDMTSHRMGKAEETAPAALAVAVHVTHADGKMERIVSDANWQVRGDETAAWAPAQTVGAIALKFGLGVDRSEAIPGPDRVVTDASLLRKEFSVGGQVKSARLIVTALGAYHAYLNHQSVAPNTLLAPGWTDFHKRVQYQTYDVTSMVKRGENAIGIEMGGGWYSSPMTWTGYRDYAGPNLLRAQLEITLANGERKTIATDATWQTAAAPITFSEIYGGESYDARLYQRGWDGASFHGAGWTAAVVGAPVDAGIAVVAQPDLQINTVMTVKPIHLDVASTVHPAIYDMGQNMVGNVRVHLHGPRGTIVKLRYVERLNPDGSAYTENLRNADATDTYVMNGEGEETWTPEFTFHGFRYVELSFPGGGPAPTPTLASVEGLVFNSLPPKPTVRLTSSSETLNKMNELGAWGQRGNFVSIPTDCPQRDERLGWMGDAGVFWRTGSYNFDIDAFSHKFMDDVTDAQTSEGAFTNVSPNLLGHGGAPGWGDAGVFIPYAAWLQYGDVELVKKSWPAMERWMEFIHSSNPNWLREKALFENYGDWLAPDEHTPRDLIGTAYWALVAREMAEMAKALGKQDDAQKYQDEFEHIAAAYRAKYVHADGSVEGNTQTAYLATVFTGIATKEMVPAMVAHVAKDVEAHGNHLTTGFLGTPFLMPVLDENGRTDLAFKLLLSTTYPSWGYMVSKGATTWWERWNGDTGDPGMNSYNHYAFGSVMAWVYKRAAGVDTDAAGVGFRHVKVEPHFDASLPMLHVEYDSDYGTIVSDWKQSEHKFTLTIPANTTATVTLPGGKTENVGSGVHSYSVQ